MAIGENQVADLAVRVRDVYRQAEEALLEVVADQIGRDVDHDTTPGNDLSTAGTPSTATSRAADEAIAVGRLAGVAERIVRRLDAALEGTVTDVLTEAQQRGYDDAGREVAALLNRTRNDYKRPANTGALASFVRHLVDLLRPVHRSILRQVDDGYRAAVAETFAPKAIGAKFRRRDHAQRALDRLADRGIVGFTDRSGRAWRLSTYAEMATRATSARTAVDAHLERLKGIGHELVYVGNTPQECVLCRPWEGKVLRIGSGRIGTVPVLSEVSDDEVLVEIAGTVEMAYAQGFGHPNCRHTLNAYLAGVTRIPEATEDEQGDLDRQKQRALERQVRKWKERAAVALDDDARRKANAKVGIYQDAIREHVKATGLIRQPNRERIDLGHKIGPSAPDRDRILGEHDGNDDTDATAAARVAADRAAQDAADEAARRAKDPNNLTTDADAARVAEAAGRPADPDLVEPDPEPSPHVAAATGDDEPDPVDPGGPPSELTDVELEDAMSAVLAVGDDDAMVRFEALALEQETREERERKRAEKREKDRARRAADRERREEMARAVEHETWDRIETLIDRGWDPDEATAEVTGREVVDVQRDAATLRLRAEGYVGTWAVMSRESYKDFLEAEYVRAENDVRGAMLNPRSRRAGHDPFELWWANDQTARARASEELLAWFDENGRVTLAEWRDRLITGRSGPGAREDYLQ